MKLPASSFLISASSVALIAACGLTSAAQAQTAPSTVQTTVPATVQDETREAPRRRINPYNRDIELTAPLQFNQRILGEVPIRLTAEDDLIIYARGFANLIAPLLDEHAQADLHTSLTGIETFRPDALSDVGIVLEYDPELLTLLILRIDPAKRTVESLYSNNEREEPGQAPERFSAYLNANIALTHNSREGGMADPGVYLGGAVRYDHLVFETEFQSRENFNNGEYSIDRQYARFVYDQPEAYRRWYLGDLNPETRGRQGYTDLGGFGVARQRQRFDTYRSNILAGGRRLLLQEASTVRVMRNGIQQREFILDPGQYDLSNLPLDLGSNDIELEIVGQSGQSRSLTYQAYLDTIDLEPGDYEYGAFVGVMSQGLIGERDYSEGNIAFSGYWRKAFMNRPAIGLGLQLSEDVQNITGQTQLLLGSSRLRLDAAASNAFDETGFAATLGFDRILDQGNSVSSWTVTVDYTSEFYAPLGAYTTYNSTSWAFSAAYSRRLSERWYGNALASYRISRSADIGDAYSFSVNTNYRLSPEWRMQVGLDYRVFEAAGISREREDAGITLALIWQPNYNRRAEARYDSSRNSAGVRYQKSAENRANTFGYSVAAGYDDGAGSLGGQVDYIGNRFDASLSHAAYGESFNSITDVNLTTLRVGSSIAFAGGQVGIGRNIFDSFALVRPHKNLGNRSAIVGENLENGVYVARSGALGSAVANNLSPYFNQTVRYDIEDAPRGYNVGEGVATVRPTYRSGYAIVVGRADFASAIGRLHDRNGRPLALVSGRVALKSATTDESEVFFSNSAGRFAVQNLIPGETYVVQIYAGTGTTFEFTIPEDNEGLHDLQIVTLPISGPEQ